ncbi:GL19309 [Drosophila persimilis]|uniref:GL19309 n=2 Tax=pseudoobscura subgroup TaxID=32358 RepID=B4G8J8_DROPE|nr:probable cytochrome P450 310a1 [Drosophila pseudoobscura]XP_002014682.1 probable cytochrome P450 310a1 isoform X2 [Drosophila persimilis]EDW28678.1 GL19309 [Drosophila persimilis]
MWLLLPILLYSVLFLAVRHIYSHWRRKGFPSERAGISWSFLHQAYRREFRHVEAICEAYQMGRERLLGIYCFFRPVLIVRNVELAQTILQQSNGHFNDLKWDYVKGYRRFNLLEKLSPIFATKRLSEMFTHVQRVGDHLISYLLDIEQAQGGALELDLQQMLRVYAINVIGNLIYGLDVNNFEQKDHILSSYVSAGHTSLQSFTLSRLPQKSSFTYRLRDLIKQGVEHREEHGLIRKDILQLITRFRNGNDISGDKWQIDIDNEQDKLLSIKRVAKVAEDLLKVSLDSISSNITLTLFEILQEPLIVEKLQTEIKELSNENGSLKFEELDGLKYLDMCLKETVRKYPPLPIIERICRKSYTLPNTKFTIDEGKTLMVPLLAIHRDEKYFSEPMKYKPLRFLHSEKSGDCKSNAFIGFGIGGAQCVGQNFAKMVIKVALIKLLQNFHLELDATLAETIEISHQPAPFIRTKDGLKVRLKRREIKPKFYN